MLSNNICQYYEIVKSLDLKADFIITLRRTG